MEAYQILIPLIAILFWAYTIYQYVKGRNTLFELIVWSVFWILTILLSIFPDLIIERVAKALGIKSNINAIIFLALGILFFLQFRLYFLLKKQNMIITDLVRKLALEEVDEEEK